MTTQEKCGAISGDYSVTAVKMDDDIRLSMPTAVYLQAMKANILEHDKAAPATWSPLCDKSKSDFARRILACCVAASVDWC